MSKKKMVNHCEICNKDFNNKSNFNKHINTKPHNKTLIKKTINEGIMCPLCDKHININDILNHFMDHDNIDVCKDILDFINFKIFILKSKKITSPNNEESVFNVINEESINEAINEAINEEVIDEEQINEPINKESIDELINKKQILNIINEESIDEEITTSSNKMKSKKKISKKEIYILKNKKPILNIINEESINEELINEPINKTPILNIINEESIDEEITTGDNKMKSKKKISKKEIDILKNKKDLHTISKEFNNSDIKNLEIFEDPIDDERYLLVDVFNINYFRYILKRYMRLKLYKNNKIKKCNLDKMNIYDIEELINDKYNIIRKSNNKYPNDKKISDKEIFKVINTEEKITYILRIYDKIKNRLNIKIPEIDIQNYKSCDICLTSQAEYNIKEFIKNNFI